MDNSNGFIKLHRKMLDWEWWDDINVFRLWVTMLMLANWKDKKWHGKTIPRGSFWTSMESLAEKSGLTVRQTRTAYEKLKSTGEIADEVTNSGRLVTIENYALYQDDAKKTTNGMTNDMTNEWQTNDQRHDKRATTTEEYKEYKNMKNTYIDRLPTYDTSSNEDMDETEAEELLTLMGRA